MTLELLEQQDFEERQVYLESQDLLADLGPKDLRTLIPMDLWDHREALEQSVSKDRQVSLSSQLLNCLVLGP